MSVHLSGRGWAYAGAALGGITSIAANVAHSFIPPADAPTTWSPEGGAVVGAIVWPVFLFVAVELLARVAWPHGLTWQLLRFAGMVPVAAVAALVSYRHLSGLLAHYGEEPLVCVLGPLAVDGLMVMATGAILATGQPQTTRTTAPSTVTTTVPAAPNAPSRVHAALTRTSAHDTADTLPRVQDKAAAAPAPRPVSAAPEIPTPAVVAARITPATTSTPESSAATLRPAARKPSPRPQQTGTPTDKALTVPATDIPVTAPEPAQPALPVVAPDLLRRADQVARQYRTEHGTSITPGQLAVRLKVTSEQATQALAVLGLGPNNPSTDTPTVNGNRPATATR